MINIDFSFDNPFSSRWDSGHSLHGVLIGHKMWEVQVMKTPVIAGFAFRWTIRQDHAGIRLELGLFGYNISAQIYDTRHWNDEDDNWTVY